MNCINLSLESCGMPDIFIPSRQTLVFSNKYIDVLSWCSDHNMANLVQMIWCLICLFIRFLTSMLHYIIEILLLAYVPIDFIKRKFKPFWYMIHSAKSCSLVG